MRKYTKKLLNVSSKVKLVATDIDGVLTSGEVILLENSEEIKIWNVKDRLGMHLLKQYLPEVKVAWITGRKSKQVELRAKEQKVDFLVQSCQDKIKSLLDIANNMSISLEEVAYIGDDIIDLGILKKVGLSVCPLDAVIEAKKASKYISQYYGGKGVFREVCEMILKSRNMWNEIIKK